MASWSDWIQDITKTVVDAQTEAKYVTPYEIQRLQLQALGDAGYYTEGRAGVLPVANGSGIPPSALLIGGAVLLAVVLLKA